MNFFRRRPKQPEFPANMIDLLESYGRREYYLPEEREVLGLQTKDIGILLQEQFYLLAHPGAESDRFLTAVADLVLPDGGWAVYGASTWLSGLGYSLEQLQAHPASRALLDAAVAFLQVRRTPPEKVRSYEWFHWLASGGTAETWLSDAAPAS